MNKDDYRDALAFMLYRGDLELTIKNWLDSPQGTKEHYLNAADNLAATINSYRSNSDGFSRS